MSFDAFERLLETPLGAPIYHYSGQCPISGEKLLLPRTTLAETLARTLSQTLSWSEGKMLGVLLVRDREGRLGYGKAFSGLLDGQADQPGWAPPLHQPAPLPWEANRIASLDWYKTYLQRLAAELKSSPYPDLLSEWNAKEEELRARHRLGKARRDEVRRIQGDNDALRAESRREKNERKEMRQAKMTELEPLRARFEELNSTLQEVRRIRRETSRALQKEMHDALGKTLGGLLGIRLDSLFPNGAPTGTGDCCAPKLLGWAALNALRPLALAEMWWGPTTVGDRRAGEFYAACQERCQPLLGPLLSLALRDPIRVIYRDDVMMVAEKPSGMLTVPGRYHWNQSCLATELGALPVHRLDLETSGLVVLARDAPTQAALRRQFEKGSVNKQYHALLSRAPEKNQGRIGGALGRDPSQAGRYRLDDIGKPATTLYRVIEGERVELQPLTGRSHQLRVHMAQALGCPIRGDRLYGEGGERLKLHASRLELTHPQSGERLHFCSHPPF